VDDLSKISTVSEVICISLVQQTKGSIANSELGFKAHQSSSAQWLYARFSEKHASSFGEQNTSGFCMSEVDSEWLLGKTAKSSTVNQTLGKRIKEDVDDSALITETDQIKNS
jgi:hypothetical protein